MRQLEELSLDSGLTRNIHSIIPNLFQLNQLKSLRLHTVFSRDTFDAFLGSMKYLQNRTEIDIDWPWMVENDEDDDDYYQLDYIRNEDLLRFKCLPNLVKFTMTTSHSHITLPGILKVLGHCPKWTELCVDGFRQQFSSDGNTLIDDDLYDKFRQFYYEKENTDVTTISNACFTTTPNKFKYKWYFLPRKNNIDLFQKCMI